MIPELEVLFFDVPETIESQLGHELTEEQRMAGSFAPKKVLESLLAGAGSLSGTPLRGTFAKFSETAVSCSSSFEHLERLKGESLLEGAL